MVTPTIFLGARGRVHHRAQLGQRVLRDAYLRWYDENAGGHLVVPAKAQRGSGRGMHEAKRQAGQDLGTWSLLLAEDWTWGTRRPLTEPSHDPTDATTLAMAVGAAAKQEEGRDLYVVAPRGKDVML